MKILLLLSFIFFTSCASYQKVEHLSDGTSVVTEVDYVEEFLKPEGFAENESEQPEKQLEEVELEEVGKDLDLLQVKSFSGFTSQEIGRFWQYAKKVDEITQSSCFAEALKNKNPLYNNKDETVEELLTTLRSKKPKLNFVMYYKNNSTVGYTYANSDTIWFNRKFHRNFSICEAAANTGHERSHKLGYTHDFKRTARRPHQVPYPVGNLLKQCCYNKGYKEPKREKVLTCYRSWRTFFRKRCYWGYK